MPITQFGDGSRGARPGTVFSSVTSGGVAVDTNSGISSPKNLVISVGNSGNSRGIGSGSSGCVAFDTGSTRIIAGGGGGGGGATFEISPTNDIGSGFRGSK